jgi:hypothetical protein
MKFAAYPSAVAGDGCSYMLTVFTVVVRAVVAEKAARVAVWVEMAAEVVAAAMEMVRETCRKWKIIVSSSPPHLPSESRPHICTSPYRWTWLLVGRGQR